MILEAEKVVTCATFEKNKSKRYDTPFGRFTYRDVPLAAFPYGVHLCNEGQYSYRMATKEKVLCDQLYTLPPTANYTELQQLLFKDLRIDEFLLNSFDLDFIAEISEVYRSTNVTRLAKFIGRIQSR